VSQNLIRKLLVLRTVSIHEFRYLLVSQRIASVRNTAISNFILVDIFIPLAEGMCYFKVIPNWNTWIF